MNQPAPVHTAGATGVRDADVNVPGVGGTGPVRASRRAVLAGLAAVGLAACTPSGTTGPTAEATPSATATSSLPSPSRSSAIPTPTPAGPPSAAPTPTPTPAPYPGLGIEALRQERWGTEGAVEVVAELTGEASFRRYQIHYPSDGIAIDGFMNVPAGSGPFGVVVLCHGYMPTASYELLTYTTEHADAFARAGYLVLHPSYRNHRGSGQGNNDYHVGYGRDVMHLVAMARRLPQASGGPVALWGHSMGGPPVFRALAVMPDQVACAVAYGAMSPFEADNYRYIINRRQATGTSGPLPEPTSPEETPELYAAVSAGEHWQGLRTPMQIHHGGQDEQVDPAWSQRLDEQLTTLGTPHETFFYPGQLHNLAGTAKQQLWDRSLALFAEHLR